MSPDSDELVELREVLQLAHDAFQREKARAEALEFEVQRLERDLEILRVEANSKGLRARLARAFSKINWRNK